MAVSTDKGNPRPACRRRDETRGRKKGVQLANSVETSALKITRFLLQVFSFLLSDFSSNSAYMNQAHSLLVLKTSPHCACSPLLVPQSHSTCNMGFLGFKGKIKFLCIRFYVSQNKFCWNFLTFFKMCQSK